MRRPITFIAEIDEENLVVNSAGEVRHDTLMIIDDSWGAMGAIRAGYYCAKCLEGQEKPFPKNCWVCGFPMADRQAEFLAKGYRGNIRVGPSSSREDEDALMQEWAEREARRQRDPILSTSQVWMPGDPV